MCVIYLLYTSESFPDWQGLSPIIGSSTVMCLPSEDHTNDHGCLPEAFQVFNGPMCCRGAMCRKRKHCMCVYRGCCSSETNTAEVLDVLELTSRDTVLGGQDDQTGTHKTCPNPKMAGVAMFRIIIMWSVVCLTTISSYRYTFGDYQVGSILR